MHMPNTGSHAMPQKLYGSFHFSPHDPVYVEHFPGAPCVPGSFLVAAFTQVATQHVHAGPWHAHNFRFRSFVPPGTHPFCVEYSTTELRCTLHVGELKAITGKLLCR